MRSKISWSFIYIYCIIMTRSAWNRIIPCSLPSFLSFLFLNWKTFMACVGIARQLSTWPEIVPTWKIVDLGRDSHANSSLFAPIIDHLNILSSFLQLLSMQSFCIVRLLFNFISQIIYHWENIYFSTALCLFTGK